ncbi:hypothetical protein [Desertibacillus haloalkaliphilus]|uniref:hypothetical protein n=1 Tax=Desertibacillus haloalkaliphilus TaxID=1328930 RepID=UPI001C26EDF0|nr:hypothetical protein [Desertibacillus haloalkaliphilus]MBU8907481.1 hypothetical protein [Desertibacillus haloalkaliphilus]
MLNKRRYKITKTWGGFIIKIRTICTIVAIVLSMGLVGCVNKDIDVKSSLVFYGESDTWTGTLYVEQPQNNGENTFQVNQLSNLTYKGDFEKISKKQKEEDGIPVSSSFGGVNMRDGGSGSHIQQATGWNNARSHSGEYATKDDEFKVVVEWDNKKETFIMTFNEEKTSKAQRLGQEEVLRNFYEPQK